MQGHNEKDSSEQSSKKDEFLEDEERFIKFVEQGEYKKAFDIIGFDCNDSLIKIKLTDLVESGISNTRNPKIWVELISQIPTYYSENICFYTINKIFKREEKNLEAILMAIRENISLQVDFFPLLIKLCIEKSNAILLDKIHKLLTKETQTCISSLEKPLQDKAEYLLSRTPEEQHRITNFMSQFRNGFGNILHDGGLLSCAQIQARKNKRYSFNPTLLSSDLEFREFLNLLKEDYRSRRVQFIVSGAHWLSGEIQLALDGTIRLLLLDSLGEDVKRIFSNMSNADEVLSIFSQVFPDSQIYFSINKRQHANDACQAFALDDVRHIITAEKYLEKKYEETGLFGYLANHRERSVEIKLDEKRKMEVNLCKLPLSLERTMQSKKLHKEIESRPKSEQDQPVNKKGKTAKESVAAAFVETKLKDKNTSINTRLQNKLKKMADYNEEYLKNTSEAEVEAAMFSFTLDGFKSRHIPSLIRENAWDAVKKELANLPPNVYFDAETEKALQLHGLRESMSEIKKMDMPISKQEKKEENSSYSIATSHKILQKEKTETDKQGQEIHSGKGLKH